MDIWKNAENQKRDQMFNQAIHDTSELMGNTQYITRIIASLKRSTAEISAVNAEIAELKNRIESGEYTVDKQKEFKARVTALEATIEKMIPKAQAAADAITDEYVDMLVDDSTLKPERLTDDARLIELGIPLTAADILAMAKRNEHNSTMMRLIRYYAEQHEIKLPDNMRFDLDAAQRIEDAKAIKGATAYYMRWIATDSAETMLERFFADVYDFNEQTDENDGDDAQDAESKRETE